MFLLIVDGIFILCVIGIIKGSNMKKVGNYVMVIDLSSKLRGTRYYTGPVLYQVGADTMRELKRLLKDLNLNFVAGTFNSIYCATIGKWNSKNKKYQKAVRTGDGLVWYKESDSSYYDPNGITHVNDWVDIDDFKNNLSCLQG